MIGIFVLFDKNFDKKVNKNSFDLKSLKIEAKRTEVLNLIHAGLPTKESDLNIWSA